MKRVERHNYHKVDNEWKVLSTYFVEFEPFKFTQENIDIVSNLIRKNLTKDLVEKKYKSQNDSNPMYGHCYHVTQAAYYLFDTDKLVSYSAIDDRGEPHWWLQYEDQIIDITADQFKVRGVNPPYEKGKPSKWYGWRNRPHKKSLKLIEKVIKNKDLVSLY
jgi:hypothetical protein